MAKDPRLTKYRLEGYNKPKRTPGHPTKSHVVLAKEGDDVKLIRFGQQGVKGSPPKKNESDADKARAHLTDMCEQLLANTVIENYDIHIEKSE